MGIVLVAANGEAAGWTTWGQQQLQRWLGSPTLPTALAPNVFVTDSFQHKSPAVGQQVGTAVGTLLPNHARYYDAYQRCACAWAWPALEGRR